ncbi:MAG: T9SS type A sorting domain-containing protein [Ignavibacteria bacterium]|nr:T9SS type A sorting domain-containing protein [Ignavibacteria bacterium]
MKTTLYLALLCLMVSNSNFLHSQGSTITEVNVNGRTVYDMQSLGSTHMLEVNPSNPLEMHACFLVSTDPPPAYTNRNVRYFYTSNGGTSWDYIGEVAQTRAGFPSLTFTNDSRAVILTSSSDNGSLRTLVYVDVFAGAGTWTTLDPGLANSIVPLNPVGIIRNTNNHLFFTCSPFKNSCTNFNPPGTFSGYTNIDSFSSPIMSAIDVTPDKIGIAFITSMQTNVAPGSVKFIESSNSGLSWSEPVTIWAANYNTDSLAALRGIDCSYYGETPSVVFEVCKRSPTSGEYFPKKISHIIFWSPTVNNGSPQKIDSSMGLTGSNPTNDVFSGVCRPVIGYSVFSSVYFVAYCKARNDTDAAGNNFFDIHLKCTVTSGALWGTSYQITNTSGPLRDFRYPSIAEQNNAIHITAQRDSIPGSSINGSSTSNAQIVFIKVYDNGLSCSPIGIQNINNIIPEEFELKQNYPNPFNPVTQIEFSVPVNSFVKLKVYNSAGELVSILAEGEMARGSYKADFNAANLASGVYYYVMEYNEENSGRWNSISKKMVLIK